MVFTCITVSKKACFVSNYLVVTIRTFQWMEDTYGVTLVAERPLKGELWHSDVIKLAVEHEKEGLIG